MSNSFVLSSSFRRVWPVLVSVFLGLILLLSSCTSPPPNASMDFSVQLNGETCNLQVSLVGTQSMTDASQLKGYAHEFKSTDTGVKMPCGWEDAEIKILGGYSAIGAAPEINPLEQGQALALVEWENQTTSAEENEHEGVMVFPLFSSRQPGQKRYSYIFADPETQVTGFRLSIKLPNSTESALESSVTAPVKS